MEKDEGEDFWTENSFMTYRFPNIDLYARAELEEKLGTELPDGYTRVHVDEETTHFQEIELEINND